MKTFVYRNLRKRCFSLRDAKTRLVVDHAKVVFLKDVVFKVSEAGRQRVLRERRKNVHAGIEGTRTHKNHMKEGLTPVVFKYDPYYAGFFFDVKTGKPITEAEFVDLGTGYAIAWVEKKS